MSLHRRRFLGLGLGGGALAGMTCFMVAGFDPHAVVEQLAERRIVASTTPYSTSYARLAPGLFNNPAEVDAVVAAIAELA